jgi:hypothetical protein
LVVSVIVAVLASQAGAGEGSTSDGSQRAVLRIKAAVELGGGVHLVDGTTLGGAALQGEVGVMFEDRLSISARLALFGNPFFALIEPGLGLSLDYTLGDRWFVGGGLMLRYVPLFDVGSPVIVSVPVRASFAFSGRKANEVARRGWIMGLEVAGGVVIIRVGGRGGTTPVMATPSLSAVLNVGYAWW